MNISAARRKIKALSILERINRYHRDEVVDKFNQSKLLMTEVERQGGDILKAVQATESDMLSSMLSNPGVYSDVSDFQYDYLDNLYSLQRDNSMYKEKLTMEVDEIKSELIQARSKTTLIKDKHTSETKWYAKNLEALREI